MPFDRGGDARREVLSTSCENDAWVNGVYWDQGASIAGGDATPGNWYGHPIAESVAEAECLTLAGQRYPDHRYVTYLPAVSKCYVFAPTSGMGPPVQPPYGPFIGGRSCRYTAETRWIGPGNHHLGPGCPLCPPGKYQPLSGQAFCLDCFRPFCAKAVLNCSSELGNMGTYELYEYERVSELGNEVSDVLCEAADPNDPCDVPRFCLSSAMGGARCEEGCSQMAPPFNQTSGGAGTCGIEEPAPEEERSRLPLRVPTAPCTSSDPSNTNGHDCWGEV